MKPVLKFNIRNQKISRVDNFLPVRYSKNYLYAEFDFKTEDWTLVAKTAIFTSQNHTIHVVLGATDTCLVPPEVLTDTWFTVSVFGGDLITVTTEKIKLYESGYRPDGVPDPTPDVYTQLLNMVSSKADGLRYSDNILSLLSGDKTIATVTITSASDEGDSTAREIELRNNGTYIQWKYTDETLWRDLVSLEDISGKDAYKYAQEAGYTKSEEQFAIDLAKEPGATEEQAKQIEQNKKDISSLSEANVNLEKRVTNLEQNGTGSGGVVVSSAEPSDDDIPKVFLNGDEFSNMTAEKNEVNMELDYVSKTEKFHSFIKIKWQGSSSINYAKKNFTIKMFGDEARETKLKKLFKDWKFKSNKYVLKANWIDHSHARNIISANLWNEVVSSRSDYDTLPTELKESPKNGAIDGFPVKVYVNGTYQGIYTWNIGKDDWMWNMDEDNPNHVLLCGETNTNGTYAETPCNFRALWGGTDGTHWSVEVGTNSTSVKNSLNALISCVKDTDDETFKATIGNYLDVKSAIQAYIHDYVICGLDGLGKNILIGTYDLIKWFFGKYDMDSTFGLYWNGSSFVGSDYACPEDYQEKFNLLFERIEKLFTNELRTEYFELRKTVYSISNMFSKFERFTDLIGSELYAEDLTIYSGIPQGSTNNIKQLRNYIRDRLVYCDGQFEAMREPSPCTGITLDKTTLTFDEAITQTLVATVEPSDTTDIVLWESDDTNVATVSNGVVTPIAKGTCTITVTCGNYSAICNVTVNIEEVVTYTITRTLTNCTSSSEVTSVIEGKEHVETLTSNDGYSMDGGTVTVTMGGVDISSSYSNGTLTISSVTGNIVIVASAKKIGTDIPLYPLASGEHTFSDGTVVTVSNGNHVKIVTGSKAVSSARINISNVSQNTETITNTGNTPNTPSIFTLGSKGESVVTEKYNTVCLSGNNTNSNMSVYFTQVGTTYTRDLLTGHLIGNDFSLEKSYGAYNVGAIGMWFNASTNTTVEFDLKVTVGEQRYI